MSSEIRNDSPGIRARTRIIRSLIVAVTLFLLVSYGQGSAMTKDRAVPREFTIYPYADGSVTDSNWDGSGDSILDGVNSVVVGFNSLGPGEHRGVYEFDVRDIQRKPHIEKVYLQFQFLGTRSEGTDYNLTLSTCRGNGLLDLSDFSCDRTVTAFDISENVEFPQSPITIDVTKPTRKFIQRGAKYISYVIRPNPSAKEDIGALLFNSNELWVYDIPPAQLTFRSK